MTWSEVLRKLTSRKLWVAVGLILGTWLEPHLAAQAQGVISAIIGVGYMLAEGIADAGNKQ